MAFKFTERTIVPGGRYKYGEYLAAGNVTSKISSVVYGGNSSTDVIGGGGGSDNGGDVTDNNFNMYLSQTNGDFDGALVAVTPQTASTRVVGFKGQEQMETYIGVIDQNTTASTSGGQVVYDPPLPANYGITAVTNGVSSTSLPQGMAVVVTDNATTGTTLIVSIDNTYTANTGTLLIPCNISMNAMQDLDDDIIDWVQAHNSEHTMSVVLEYTWAISAQAQTAYRLDLSNDAGSINCDDDGNVLTGATRPSCQATLYFGNDPYTGATYNLIYNNSQNVVGLGYHTSNGVCYIDYDSPTYFNFDGDHLDIGIQASVAGQVMGTKVFTITKSMPSEGHPATSYWLVFNSSSVKVNPNTNPVTVTPTAITADVMMQVGQDTPTAATGCSIYYGYTTSPATSYPNTGVTVDVSKEALYFVAKKGNVIVDGVEQIPILNDGEKGAAGQSAYRLDLTNENASINCDSSGNILTGAVRPTCTAKLYLGTTACTGVSYSISSGSCSYSGVSIDSSTGVITFNPGTASTPFNFNTGYTSIEFTIEAKINNVLYGTAIMTVSRNYAGENGESAVNYWLVLDADEIKLTTANTFSPATITASAYKQIGENTPIAASDATIKWGYDTVSPTTTYSSTITVTGTSHNYITFQLLAGGVVRDTETVLILRDGKDGTGTQGRQGAAIRGPIDWYDGASQSGRRWCNGVYTTSAHPEDASWIDVIVKDGTYYYCNTSYTEAGQGWDVVKPGGSDPKWTSADTEFDFVATNILLANDAKINFLSGNEIYMMDSSNTGVTAGVAGGEGISFWAGSDTPGDAPFQVNYDGSIKATSGTFSGYIQMPYTFVANLNQDIELSASTVGTLYLSQTHFLGRFSSAPSSPSTGDSYYNTSYSPGRFYYCRVAGSWTLMTRVQSGGSDVIRGYIADNHAYLIADGQCGFYGMGDGGTLVLPAPKQSLNGFVYDILVEANYATKSQGTENPGLEVFTSNYGTNSPDYFYTYCFSTGYIGQATRLLLYGGRARFVCVPRYNNGSTTYVWAVTDATGGLELWNSTGRLASFSPIHGYATGDNAPLYRIQADSSLPATKYSDTLYVTRS